LLVRVIIVAVLLTIFDVEIKGGGGQEHIRDGCVACEKRCFVSSIHDVVSYLQTVDVDNMW
jgi:hypothetical protein